MHELDTAALRRLNRMIFIVRAVIYWETLWPRLWPFLIISSLFLAAILFNLFTLLSPVLHVLVLGAFCLACVGSLAYGVRGVAYPDKTAALHKLERDSALSHQPLFALLDQPVGEQHDKLSQAIWIKHQDRMVTALKQVVVNFPRSRLYKRDPYSLRAGLILLLVLGAIEARFDYGSRFAQAFSLHQAPQFAQGWRVEAWINPPAYTGLGPAFLQADDQSAQASDAVSIVQHSQILIRLEGAQQSEDLRLAIGGFEEEMQALGRGAFSLETTVDQGDELRLLDGDQLLYRWPVHLVADLPPTIALDKSVKTGFRGHMTLGFEAKDDFGLKQVQLKIHPLKPDGRGDLVLVQDESATEVKGSFRHNLSDHPWAGQTVVVTPIAIDSANQTNYGQALQMVLPERRFTHPIARELVKIRRSLLESTPEDRLYAQIALDQILRTPETFADDVAVYLALRVASDRLHIDMATPETEAVRVILWETAVRLEEGASGSARNQLEFMSRQLQDLMGNAGDRAGMEALFEQMQKSLDEFLRQMSQSMPDMEGFEGAANLTSANMIGRDELMALLNKARDLMRAGDTQAAKAVMEQFQSILSRLAMQEPPDPEMMQAAKEMVEQLRALEEAQQDLLDRTFQRTRSGDAQSLEATKQAIQQAEEQRQLHDQLQEQIKRLREMNVQTPETLKDAQAAMDRAATALERGLDDVAIQAQGQAVDQLRKGLQESAQSLAQQMGMQSLPRQLPGYDPLGRRSNKGPIADETGRTVPDEVEMKRSREILKELYRRAGQKGRTEQELKYIDRLLERF
ncbi:DUF4175 domain-containing protein [Terasakiella pusilla]|uniref:DUF4175 domain-containing protein n=1 Tax=Terasakiella pusilla TaxID=64973 RepID=UPI003AA92200